jgi:hypothetical protein
MRNFKDLLSDPSQFITYLQDRINSTHRKPTFTIWVWDPSALSNLVAPGGAIIGANGKWINLSAYGFDASISYGDFLTGAASSATIQAVDPSKTEWNPFFGSKAYLLRRGIKMRIDYEELDMPLSTPLTIFVGVVTDASYTHDRDSKKSSWSVDLTVLNYLRWFKNSNSPGKNWYPVSNKTNVDYPITVDAKKGDMTLQMEASKIAGNYTDQTQIFLMGPDGTDDSYFISIAAPAETPLGGQSLSVTGTLHLTTQLLNDFPAGTVLKKGYSKTKLETDTGWIARDLLGDTGLMYTSDESNQISPEELLRDIPNTGIYIQSKVQFVGQELGTSLRNLLSIGGYFPYIRPSDGHIIGVNIHDKIKPNQGSSSGTVILGGVPGLGDTTSITLGTDTFTYTALAGDTINGISGQLVSLINTNLVGVTPKYTATVVDSTITINSPTEGAVTLSARGSGGILTRTSGPALTGGAVVPDKVILYSDIKGLTYHSDYSNLCNQYQVVGQSPIKSRKTLPAKSLFSTSGSIGWWTNSSKIESNVSSPYHGWEYLEWIVYGDQDRKLQIHEWLLNPQGTHVPQLANFFGNPVGNFMLEAHWGWGYQTEYEASLRLYYNNTLRSIPALILETVVVMVVMVAISTAVSAVLTAIKTTAAVGAAVPVVGSVAAAAGAAAQVTDDAWTKPANVLAFLQMAAQAFSFVYTLMSVSDYAADVWGVTAEDYLMQITTTTTMPDEILNSEGTILETEENFIVSTSSMASYLARLMLTLKRGEATKVDLSMIYDPQLEPGDVIGVQIGNDPVSGIPKLENFLIRSFSFDASRGSDLLTKYSTTWIDPALSDHMSDIPVMVSPIIEVRQCWYEDWPWPQASALDPHNFLGLTAAQKFGYWDPLIGRTKNNYAEVQTIDGEIFGVNDIPLIVNHDPPKDNQTQSDYQNEAKTVFRHEMIRINIINHGGDILNYVKPGGPKYKYVYAYSTIEKEIDEPTAENLRDNPQLAADEFVRAAEPQPSLFTHIDYKNPAAFDTSDPTNTDYGHDWKWGVGLKRKQNPGLPNNAQILFPANPAPVDPFSVFRHNDAVIGYGPYYEFQGPLNRPTQDRVDYALVPDSDEIVPFSRSRASQSDSTAGTAQFPEGGLFGLFNSGSTSHQNYVDQTQGGLDYLDTDANNNAYGFEYSGTMFVEDVPTDITDGSLSRRFYVALPLPGKETDDKSRRIYIRVGLVQCNDDNTPNWASLQLSNSYQIQVEGCHQ